MRYDKYIATNFVMGEIKNTLPHDTVAAASREFFTDYPHMHVCQIKRVSVKPSGDMFTDPEFKMRKVGKITA